MVKRTEVEEAVWWPNKFKTRSRKYQEGLLAQCKEPLYVYALAPLDVKKVVESLKKFHTTFREADACILGLLPLVRRYAPVLFRDRKFSWARDEVVSFVAIFLLEVISPRSTTGSTVDEFVRAVFLGLLDFVRAAVRQLFKSAPQVTLHKEIDLDSALDVEFYLKKIEEDVLKKSYFSGLARVIVEQTLQGLLYGLDPPPIEDVDFLAPGLAPLYIQQVIEHTTLLFRAARRRYKVLCPDLDVFFERRRFDEVKSIAKAKQKTW